MSPERSAEQLDVIPHFLAGTDTSHPSRLMENTEVVPSPSLAFAIENKMQVEKQGLSISAGEV